MKTTRGTGALDALADAANTAGEARPTRSRAAMNDAIDRRTTEGTSAVGEEAYSGSLSGTISRPAQLAVIRSWRCLRAPTPRTIRPCPTASPGRQVPIF